ncbi:MAG: glycosyltransferase family 4 protein [Ardenticatenaceae bacterium]|nr:glycosyltransferase family 4 protein [Anaerolineales bacterium]MCB8921135.1 glycosyltransferase family 4 protein [Ardenticatenaceae bacterium]MCB8990840.1 glycosyltransferase family 4 protein [Ardenticatenaceae bacterium]MCB9004466.1 glycosyltransferase family 4 protein [Ardenticatenaceae bacterium]
MRILMLSKACLVGAYQRKLEEIARFDDTELLVVVPPSWDDPAAPVQLERAHTEGYTLLADPIHLNGRYHLHHYPRLRQRLADFRPDIVHIDEEPYNLATWLAMRQAKAVGAKTLFFSWQNLQRRYPFPFSWLEKQVLAGVDYALMGNREAVQVWQAKGYRGPHRVIPQFGVDPTLYASTARHDDGRTFTIGSANRRLVPEKGVDLLLHAAAQLPGIWQVHIAGEGPAKPALARLAQELGIAERVHFDGPIPSAQMAGYLQQLDVLVLSSRTQPNWKEQFGRVLVEAMACETAVIGSNSGEIPHVIGDAGLVFPEGDADALRDALLRLMQSSEERRALGKKGRQRVLDTYTQAQIAAQTVAVYRTMI